MENMHIDEEVSRVDLDLAKVNFKVNYTHLSTSPHNPVNG